MGSPNESTTTVSPNQYDIEKAKTADLMNSFMMTNIQQGMQGQKGALDDSSTQNILNQLRQNAGRYQISPGSNTFQQTEQKMGEALTMPKGDMTNLAMSLYGQSQPASGAGESQSHNYNPNEWMRFLGPFTGSAQ
jgi:hypothetical protein